MASFSQFGNDLYTGKRSINLVHRQKTWYAISAILLILAAFGVFGKGLNFGLEFRGGSEMRISGVTSTQNFDVRAKNAMASGSGIKENVTVTKIGSDTVRVQTEKLNEEATNKVRQSLADAFHVSQADVSANFIGASWGADVSRKAISALIWFLVLVSIVLAIYFRTWKMAISALVALIHDLVITVGIYALAGFEITPASMIGFLTILGYSLYDTVVVFDKVRENTRAAESNGRENYSQAANAAVNQTLVRSINTSVVALLPVASILVVGFLFLGPGTLLDLSLALFVGIAVGTYSSIFVATPLLADLREREPAMKELAKKAAKYQSRHAAGQPLATSDTPSSSGVSASPDGSLNDALVAAGSRQPGESETAPHGTRKLHPYAQSGPRNQPKRSPRSRR